MNIEVVRVFTDESGNHGNPLGVVRDSAAIDNTAAQALAATLGYSETVFIDEPDAGALRIYTPATRLPFAGHPTVGAAWYLHQAGLGPGSLATDAGRVEVEASLAGATVLAAADMCPAWNLVQLADPAEVDAVALTSDADERSDYVWAWIDEAQGLVRARCFATQLGLVEDEATGSAAIVLAESLGRAITVRQGAGSVLVADPTPAEEDGIVGLSGWVFADDDLTRDARDRVA